MTSWGNGSTSSFMAEGTVRVSLVKCLRVEKVYGSAVNIFSGFMRSLINRGCVYLLLTGRAFRTSTVWDTGPGRGCVWQILTGRVLWLNLSFVYGFIVQTARLLLLSSAGHTVFVFWVWCMIYFSVVFLFVRTTAFWLLASVCLRCSKSCILLA